MSLTKRRTTMFIVVYSVGVAIQGVLFGLTLVWGITGTLEQHRMAIIIMAVQGALLLRSGGWWLPVAAKITGAGPEVKG